MASNQKTEWIIEPVRPEGRLFPVDQHPSITSAEDVPGDEVTVHRMQRRPRPSRIGLTRVEPTKRRGKTLLKLPGASAWLPSDRLKQNRVLVDRKHPWDVERRLHKAAETCQRLRLVRKLLLPRLVGRHFGNSDRRSDTIEDERRAAMRVPSLSDCDSATAGHMGGDHLVDRRRIHRPKSSESAGCCRSTSCLPGEARSHCHGLIDAES